jgi:hypothetical protein
LIEEEADASIRRVWHDGQWYFSVIDVIGVLTNSTRPRKYWNDLKKRLTEDEGFSELSAKIGQLKMASADGKYYRTDAADQETVLRIVQSVPSPKAEPIKQWLAKVGAQRLDEVLQPLPAPHVATAVAAVEQPAEEAPALAWAEYYERLAALYRRQAAYEARLTIIEARQDRLEDRMESVEEVSRLLPDILGRLGPQTLTPEHQATVKHMAKRLNEVSGISYATIYSDLNAAFHVGKYGDILDSSWVDVATWFTTRIEAAERRRNR